MNLSDARYDILQRAPVAVFMLVAGADGTRSPLERQAYLSTWRTQVDADVHGPMSSDPRYEQVWQWLFTADEGLVEEMAATSDDVLWDVVEKAGRILRALDEKCDVTEADAVVRALVALARIVAQAPTMTFLGITAGATISDEEGTTIRRVVHLLRLDKVTPSQAEPGSP